MYKDLFDYKDIHQKARYLIYSWSPPSPQIAVPILKKTAKALAVAGTAAAAGLLIKKAIKKLH